MGDGDVLILQLAGIVANNFSFGNLAFVLTGIIASELGGIKQR